MPKPSLIVLGGTGLIGSAVCSRFARDGHPVIAINSKNYASHLGASADILINCNGNSYRYKAAQDPRWDFDASVLSVEKSIFDFACNRYVYISTIDVYPEVSDPTRNHEESLIDPQLLHPYGFHKWIAERMVERFAKNPLVLRVGTMIGPGVKKGPLFDLLHRQPLHMSPDSELSLVDTDTVTEALVHLLATPPAHRIINLTGTGPVSLRQLCSDAGLEWTLAEGAERVVHRYHINNDRLRTVFPAATSHEIGRRFLAEARRSSR